MSEKVKGRQLDDLLGDIVGLLDAVAITAPCHVVGSALGEGMARLVEGQIIQLDLEAKMEGHSWQQ